MNLNRLLFLSVLATGALPAILQAQPLHADNAHQQHIYDCLSDLKHANAAQAQKGTATNERLIAYSWYEKSNTNYVLRDTSRMKYSGSRGSYFNTYILRYWFDYLMDFTTSGTYRDVTDIDIAADSVNTYLPGVGTNYRAATYDNNNKIATYEEKPGTFTQAYHGMRIRNSYNANGYVHTTLTTGRSTASGQWDSLYIRKMAYNSSGFLRSDTVYQQSQWGWILGSVQQYAHDLRGNLVERVITQRSGS